MRGWRNGLAAATLGVAIWQVIVWATGLPHFILPGPLRVAKAFADNWEIIAKNGAITVAEVLIGLLIGSVLGAITAVQLASSPRATALMRPIVVFLQAIPVFALAPVLTLWLGYGVASKIAIAVLIIYFPVASNFFDGLNRTPQGWLDLARTMGASDARIMWRVRIPAATPSLASGLRLAAVYAPIGVFFGEWVGSSWGLGYLVSLANGRAKIDLMFAAIIVLAIFTVALFASMDHLCKRLTERVS